MRRLHYRSRLIVGASDARAGADFGGFEGMFSAPLRCSSRSYAVKTERSCEAWWWHDIFKIPCAKVAIFVA